MSAQHEYPRAPSPGATMPASDAEASVPPAPWGRALAPDLARGWMLLFIAFANIMVYLWGQEVFAPTVNHPVTDSPLDRVLSVFGVVFIEQRVYPMFAFLFGYGMVQFARSRAARGFPAPVITRMLQRRHWWLILFGAVHALLLFSGDILGAYGLAGLILTAALFSRSDRAIRITVWILVGIVALFALFMVGVGVLMGMLPPEYAALAASSGVDSTGSNADIIAGQANYWLAMIIRLGLWLLATPMTVLGLVVPAAMLLGWLAARHAWLERPGAGPRLGLVAAVGIGIGAVGGIPQALLLFGDIPGFASASWAFLGVVQLTGLAGGIGYAALFGLIGIRLQGRQTHAARWVAAVGQRSLTFYLLQSVIFAPLLSAWGLGLGSSLGTAAAYGIAVAVWLVSIGIAVLLDRRGARGPAEMLLRRLTYGRYDPQPPNQVASALP